MVMLRYAEFSSARIRPSLVSAIVDGSSRPADFGLVERMLESRREQAGCDPLGDRALRHHRSLSRTPGWLKLMFRPLPHAKDAKDAKAMQAIAIPGSTATPLARFSHWELSVES
jgi:hypothetical protein